MSDPASAGNSPPARKTRKSAKSSRRAVRRKRAAQAVNLSKVEWEHRIRQRLENVAWERLNDELDG